MDGLNDSEVLEELFDDSSSESDIFGDDSDEDPNYVALELSNDSGM